MTSVDKKLEKVSSIVNFVFGFIYVLSAILCSNID